LAHEGLGDPAPGPEERWHNEAGDRLKENYEWQN
jgi:hypothetical protein